ncbi:1-deoxy-D-xylulose-5-phosphate reductoisomerase [Desulfonatronovibrio hydrogenovorans]|uniref:1-deoxy-D-xylulose-5-phosphate reductoisomerase n=1 Tax=Desulfonatronovibrio hydrogenovorans TaxID=53245 RepID=UPI000490DA1F|nr:1-deoxy-D-xylulose-5-phosphate reductoisomerase [Desulfonatronovibrio hydrogenovorans]
MISYISSLDISRVVPAERSLVILGSTGSIGTSALEVVRKNFQKFRISGLAGARNIFLLAKQANEFRPPVLGVLDSELAQSLRLLLDKGYSPEIVYGPDGYAGMASMDSAGMVLSAMVGAAGLVPTMAAIRAGKAVLLANKESLVLAGHLIRQECAASGGLILPVDSEHNAVFQALQGHNFSEVDSIIITASGGPFRDKDPGFMHKVTPDQALAHPNWSMGAKISIDSATMMNKGLEIIEAHHLFGLPVEKIRVLVHPQSIVHSLVAYSDGSLLAHMGMPDMQIPIAHCLGYPDRLNVDLEALDLSTIENLSFFRPDSKVFPCLGLAVSALEKGPSHAVVLNAANEICVEKFLAGHIGFMDIPALNEKALNEHRGSAMTTLEEILNLDARTRKTVQDWIEA